MEKKKVFIPCYGRCEFGSLEEVVNYVKRLPGGLSVYIDDIVMYNIRFRDCLREKGIDGVIKMLRDEAPTIALERETIDRLKEKWTNRMGSISLTTTSSVCQRMDRFSLRVIRLTGWTRSSIRWSWLVSPDMTFLISGSLWRM